MWKNKQGGKIDNVQEKTSRENVEILMRIITLNASEMKSFNRRRILEHLRIQSTSRAELSRVTGLTRSAISLIVDGLLQDGILREGCEQGGRVGRKSVILDINPGAFYSIGLSITPDDYAVGLVDFGGTIQRRVSKPIDSDIHVREVLDCIGADIDALLLEHPLPGRLLGMGITAPGPLDTKRGIILRSPGFEKWSDLPIVEFFSNRVSGAILLENHANALALAEKTFCLKGAYESFIEIVVDTGVGAGLIIEGDLYKGGTGFGNEFGHASINMNGPRCSCGNYGCAELYASIPNLLAALSEKNPELDSWAQIADLSKSGNPAACEALEREAEYLAGIIVNAVNILDVEAVVLSGDIAYHADELNDKITRKVNDRFMGRENRQIKILASLLTGHPATLSSANLALENYVRLGEPRIDGFL